MSESRVLYRYTGDGRAWFAGVPKRDLTASDVAALTPEARRNVEAGTLYQPVAKKTDKSDKPVAPAAPDVKE
jgi:hypothetical protein